ncbi:MAG: MFS transporter [Legionellales bacterium]|nr:MFS transporter [Legionellales bacterium]
MQPSWVRSTFQIAAIFAFRMLGLFMLIPVFTIYAPHLQGATPFLLGLALGSYGLTQGLLQIPFGMLSDRYGRKPLITAGLILFAIGSILGAHTHTMSGMILARILQGGGAIGSVLIALLADITAEQHRTKAMAIIGATIGLSFSIAFILSPTLAEKTGLAGIFYLTAGLAVLGLVILYLIPTPKPSLQTDDLSSKRQQLKQVFLDPALLRLDAGIFFQHFILVASFFVIPMTLQKHVLAGHLDQPWQFYLIIIGGAFLAMLPIMHYSEKWHKVKAGFVSAVILIGITQAALIGISDSLIWLGVTLFLYFVAFNFLEANLPSLISKQANPKTKGAAIGVYSSSQFLGIFVGGSLAGLVFTHAGASGIFMMNTVIAIVWLYLSVA